MRTLAVLTLSAAALLLPQFAEADPAQPQAAQATASPLAATTAAPSAALPNGVQEVVKVSPPQTADNLDEVMCKSTEPPTGTRLGASRECHTVREWKRRQQESQDITNRTQMVGHEGALKVPGGK